MKYRVFKLFDLGHRPADIYHDDIYSKLFKLKYRTLIRYYQEWKRENGM